MNLTDFDYDLPDKLIAQTPLEPRDSARLLVDAGPDSAPQDMFVRDLSSLVREGDVVVANNTRVLNARLKLTKSTGGEVEVLLLHPVGDEWEALVRPSRKVRPGTVLHREGLTVVIGEDLGEGRRRVQLDYDHQNTNGDAEKTDLAALERFGEVPLPPYIHERLADPERYQTVYANRPASVAAPTAGLHLTPQVIGSIQAAGATFTEVELVVGLGTFRPIVASHVQDHEMHAEFYRVSPQTIDACREAKRVIAIGTTTTRALETAAAAGELEGDSKLFIYGDYNWRLVDLMLTNFHVPRSSLLVMIDSFVGRRWRDLYAHALTKQYRFLSFGDAMLLQREWP